MNAPKEPTRWRDDPENRDLYEMLATLSGDPPVGLKIRVWQRLQDGAYPMRSRIAWSLALGVAASASFAIILFLVFSLSGQESVGHVTQIVGQVAVLAPNSEGYEAATSGSGIVFGATLETGQGSRALVESERRVRLVAEPSTRLLIGTLAEGETLKLEQGTVVVSVEGPKRKRPVRILAGEYDVHVVGTVFSVTLGKKGVVGVSVMEGVVRVVGPNGERKLHSGEALVTGSEEILDTGIRPDALAMLAVSKDTISEPGLAVVMIDGLRAELDKHKEIELTADKNLLVDAEEKDSEVAEVGGTKNTARRRVARNRVDAGVGGEPSKAELLFEEALSTKDKDKAMALFDRVSKMGGPWAEVASYRAARMAVRTGSPDAERRLKGVLSTHPRGKFAAEVRLTLIESYMKDRRFGPASKEIEHFLSRHAKNERVGEVRFLRGEISRIRDGNCRAALSDYAVSVGHTRRNQDAMFWRAWCLNKIGAEAESVQSFKSYLERYPKGRHAKTAKKFVE